METQVIQIAMCLEKGSIRPAELPIRIRKSFYLEASLQSTTTNIGDVLIAPIELIAAPSKLAIPLGTSAFKNLLKKDLGFFKDSA